jgi:hypothetical protein
VGQITVEPEQEPEQLKLDFELILSPLAHIENINGIKQIINSRVLNWLY